MMRGPGPTPDHAAGNNAYTAAALTLCHASLERGASIRLPVTGWSMAPLLQPGNTVWLERADPATLQRGAIVVVFRDGCLLVHRLVAVDAGGWHTKGDNNRLADPPVPMAAIQGRIVTIERDGALIEMQRQPWPIVNRLLGEIGWLEARCMEAWRRWLRRSLNPHDRLVSYSIGFPFRLVVRALVAIAFRCSTG